jgi:ABC-2 type transport system permease protein
VQADAAHQDATEKLRAALAADAGMKVTVNDEPAARQRLRTARTDLVVVPRPGSAAGHEFLYDATRSEGVLARNAADRALVRAASPSSPLPEERAVTEPGSRYIDFSSRGCSASTCSAAGCSASGSRSPTCGCGSS